MNEAENIVLLTLQMLAAAQKEDWDTLQRLENERRRRIDIYFATALSVKAGQEFTAAIQRIMAADKVLVSVLEETMLQISSKVKEISLGRHAIMAYSEL